MKTHEEALAQWVSDEIEFLIGQSHNKLTRSVMEKIVVAVNAGDSECRFHLSHTEHLLTWASWRPLRAALQKHNQVLTTAFLCRCESFLEAAFAVDPPDTLLEIKDRQQRQQSYDAASAATHRGYRRAY